MTGRQLRSKTVSTIGKKILRNGAAHFETLLGLALTSALLYGVVYSFTSMT